MNGNLSLKSFFKDFYFNNLPETNKNYFFFQFRLSQATDFYSFFYNYNKAFSVQISTLTYYILLIIYAVWMSQIGQSLLLLLPTIKVYQLLIRNMMKGVKWWELEIGPNVFQSFITNKWTTNWLHKPINYSRVCVCNHTYTAH